MPSRNPSPQSPLPVATQQLARALIRLHARLRGELVKKAEGHEVLVEPEKATEAMQHIEGVIHFLNVNFAPAAIRPIRTWPKVGPLGYGDVRAESLAALRKCGDWMTYKEIADAIVLKRKLVLNATQHEHFLQKLREAVHALKREGAVVPEIALKRGQGQVQQRWRLSSMFRG